MADIHAAPADAAATQGPTPGPPAATTGAVTGAPRALLRVEGLLVCIAAVGLFWRDYGGAVGWWGFLMFFVPDLTLLAYLAGARIGAIAYNSAHTYVFPAALALAAPMVEGVGDVPVGAAALLWAAHIGFDRALGLGLKYGSGFGDTHLGRVDGAKARPKPAANG